MTWASFLAGLIVGAFLATSCIFLWIAHANGNGLDQMGEQ
jgi:hypothetical protein